MVLTVEVIYCSSLNQCCVVPAETGLVGVSYYFNASIVDSSVGRCRPTQAGWLVII